MGAMDSRPIADSDNNPSIHPSTSESFGALHWDGTRGRSCIRLTLGEPRVIRGGDWRTRESVSQSVEGVHCCIIQ